MDLLIVDDEPLARQRLSRLLGDLPDYRVIAEAGDVPTAMQAIEQYDPDIVFCDIEMPGANGISLGQQLSTLDDPPALIFCTAYDQYALDAFGAQAVDYLMKPVARDRLEQALDKARRVNRVQRQSLQPAHASTPETSSPVICVSSHRGITRIAVDTIHCFLADQKYVTAYHDSGETLMDQTLKELETSFPDQFIRVHRNALVARNRIDSLQRCSDGNHQVILRGANQAVNVSRRHVGKLRELLVQL